MALRSRRRVGQATVEYLLVIAVIVVAVVAVAQRLQPGLADGLKEMGGDVRTMAEQGYVGG